MSFRRRADDEWRALKAMDDCSSRPDGLGDAGGFIQRTCI